MDLKEQMKESNGEFFSISEAQLQDDLEEDEKQPIDVFQMDKLAEHFTHSSVLNGYEGDATSSNFADDGVNDIDIEESKDFFNGYFRLKHENDIHPRGISAIF
ncbi:hypothetical protein LSTR_LSTR012116 [Laodelphax striatellus]|uniref:Uncharacterized protein n=1 Tax=Laodelphax striatellus TaxID=195883 RepID=A0A482WXN2_LAOST|nr:hypothetical protein LSTR_LSTR012116 [Laodelphax striatellus]